MNDINTARQWLLVIEAFEAGAFAYWVTDSEIFVATLPSVVKTDSARRLHCGDGPAFKWLDGIEDFYWHGTHIPREWITAPSAMNPSKIITWENIEQRRAGIEIMGGWSTVLRLPELGARIIDEDSDPRVGTLIEVTLPGLDAPEQFIWVQCGTGREFSLCVPHKCTTAREAQAWLRPGMTVKKAKTFTLPEVRT